MAEALAIHRNGTWMGPEMEGHLNLPGCVDEFSPSQNFNTNGGYVMMTRPLVVMNDDFAVTIMPTGEMDRGWKTRRG